MGGQCLFVCLSRQALSGLKSALSGLKSALLGLESERADFRPERADFRPKRVDYRPERADFGPERAWEDEQMNGQMDDWTNRMTNKSPPVFYRTLSPSGPLPKK